MTMTPAAIRKRDLDPDPMIFMGLIGAQIAQGGRDIWYKDGTPKTTLDLMRVPWVRDHIRAEMRERWAWRAANP